MNKRLIFLAGMITGGVLGFGISGMIFKNKYKKEADEKADKEIAKMRKYYNDKLFEENNKPVKSKKPDISENKKEEKYIATERDIRTSSDIMKENGYVQSDYMEENDNDMDDRPFLINSDIFHRTDGYEKISLVYYENNILADKNDEILDINDTVTYDNINELPDYDEAVIYVRNGHFGIDYEVIRDERTFEEATGIFLSE